MDGPRPPDIEEILAELHEDARGRLKEELLPGERLLWAARSHHEPRQPLGFVLASLLLMTFAVASVAAFRHAFSAERVGRDAPDNLVAVGLLAGIAAAVTGIGLVSSLRGAINKRWTRSQHLYAITNRRVILRTPTFDRLGIEVRAIDLPTVGSIHRTEYPEQLGTLTFSVEAGTRVVDPERGTIEPHDSYRLEKIPEVRRVELLLRQTVAEAKRPSESSST